MREAKKNREGERERDRFGGRKGVWRAVMKGHTEVEQLLDGRQKEKHGRPVLTRGQWRGTLTRKKAVKMLSAEGPLKTAL